MNRLHRVNRHGGTIDTLNISACIILIIYNTVDFILKGVGIFDIILYLFPFILYPIISIFFRSNRVTSGLYLVVGLLTIALDSANSGISGIMYIYFSYNETKNNLYGLILVGLSYMALSFRFIIYDFSGSDIVTPLFLFAFIFSTFYFKVIKNNMIRTKNITEREKAILKLYASGYSYDLIIKTLNLNIEANSVRKIITRLRDSNGFKNDIQFGKWLYEKG